MARNAQVSIAVFGLAGLGFGINRFFAASTLDALPTASAAVPVVTAPVRQGDVPILLSGIGTIEALNTAVIRSQVTGLLQTANFVEGQQVKRGELLGQVDPRPQQAALQQAQAQLGRDQAHLTNAQTNLGRNAPLLNRGYATEQQVIYDGSIPSTY